MLLHNVVGFVRLNVFSIYIERILGEFLGACWQTIHRIISKMSVDSATDAIFVANMWFLLSESPTLINPLFWPWLYNVGHTYIILGYFVRHLMI